MFQQRAAPRGSSYQVCASSAVDPLHRRSSLIFLAIVSLYLYYQSLKSICASDSMINASAGGKHEKVSYKCRVMYPV